MWAKFCGFLLRLMGWTKDGGPVAEKKAIILGVPHTSIMDFVISYLFYTSHNAGKAHVMIKKEMFVWPIKGLLRAMGGVPMDRSNATALVKGIVDEFNSKDYFVLAMCPEGTRKPIKKWKPGYHTIAKAANCPVYLGYFDWGTKHIGVGKKFELSDDARADTEKIQQIYEEMKLTGKHPENYITH